MSTREIPEHPLRRAAEVDLRRLTPHIERMTGMPSHWVGVVWVRDATLLFSGQKHRWCGISLREDVLLDEPARWRTMIHEGLHAVSGGLSAGRLDVGSRHWEEAIVEQTQRLLRQRLLREIGVDLAEEQFHERDRQHPYNAHVRALETHRSALAAAPEAFYLDLLRSTRPGRVRVVLAATRLLALQQRQEPR